MMRPIPQVKYRFARPVIMVMIGLGLAQVIGTFQVAGSNRELYHRINTLTAAGYQVVPGESIEPGLMSFQAAMGGSLFFTLTVGAFISLVTIGCLQLFKGFMNRPKWGVALVAGMMTCGLIGCNLNGFNFFGSAYLFFIPLLLCLVDIKWGVKPAARGSFYQMLLLFGPMVVMAFFGLSRFERHVFIDVRDQLLLSNTPGRIVNDFYYRYSLYPAESFKSLTQKQIRTVYLDGKLQSSIKSLLGDALAARDYLPVAAEDSADLVIGPDADGDLIVKGNHRTMRVRADVLLKSPEQTLQRIAKLFDNGQGFRKIIFISLLCGFPLLVYLIVFGVIRWVLAWFFPIRMATIGASVACIVFGLMVFGALGGAKMIKMSQAEMYALVQSSDLKKRLIGLKSMDREGMDLSSDPIYPKILKSRHVSERYWLARLLGHSHGNPTYRDLLDLLNDSSPNVICMALRSLGIRKSHQAIPTILNRLNHSKRWSNHWYVQWYAYNALKNLKWRQYALN